MIKENNHKFKAGQTVMISALDGRSPLSVMVKLPRNLKVSDYVTMENGEQVKTKIYSFVCEDVVGFKIDERDMLEATIKEGK